MKILWAKRRWEEEVILVLHFINFTAISEDIAEREECSLVIPLG